jgi:hypothetical protein
MNCTALAGKEEEFRQLNSVWESERKNLDRVKRLKRDLDAAQVELRDVQRKVMGGWKTCDAPADALKGRSGAGFRAYVREDTTTATRATGCRATATQCFRETTFAERCCHGTTHCQSGGQR